MSVEVDRPMFPVSVLALSAVALVVAAVAAGIYYVANPAEPSSPTIATSQPPDSEPVRPPHTLSQSKGPRVQPVAESQPAELAVDDDAQLQGSSPVPDAAALNQRGETPSVAGKAMEPPQVGETGEHPTPTAIAVTTSPNPDAAAADPETAAPGMTVQDMARAAPSVEAGQVAIQTGGKLQAPDPVPQTAGTGSDGQVQFTPQKPDLKYPNLGSRLNQLVASVETGRSTAGEAALGAILHQEESVAVTIYLSENVDGVAQFLEDNGGDPRNVGQDYIEAYVPVTLLGPLSEQPGVLRVREIVPPQVDGQSRTGSPARP